ncbi:MAG: hypothetical protein ACRCYY_14435 [Trueperaceae bacterium]
MKFKVSSTKILYSLIVLLSLAGVASILTLSIGRALTMFAYAAFIYLGIGVMKQLASLRELLSYTSLQSSSAQTASAADPVVPQSFKERLQQRFGKNQTQESGPAQATETRIYEKEGGAEYAAEDDLKKNVTQVAPSRRVRGAPAREM